MVNLTAWPSGPRRLTRNQLGQPSQVQILPPSVEKWKTNPPDHLYSPFAPRLLPLPRSQRSKVVACKQTGTAGGDLMAKGLPRTGGLPRHPDEACDSQVLSL
jgi:hypothetical protein